MTMKNNWDSIVKNKISGLEKSLPEGDLDTFLVKAKRKRLHKAMIRCGIFLTSAAVILLCVILNRPDDHVPANITESKTPIDNHAHPTVIASTDTKYFAEPPKAPKYAECKRNECLADNIFLTHETPSDKSDDTSSVSTKHANYGNTNNRPTKISDDFPMERPTDSHRKRRKLSISVSGDLGGSQSLTSNLASKPSIGNPIFGDDKPTFNPSATYYEYEHKRPITFGLSASYVLTPRVSIVSGLEYSRYNSSIHDKVRDTFGKQRAEYLGIPLRVDYQALRSNHFAIYTGMGVKADWCIKATYAGEKFTDNGLNWTAYAAIGAQYEIFRGISVYLEPEISYFLNYGDRQLQTYRTKHPLMLSAALGLRLTL